MRKILFIIFCYSDAFLCYDIGTHSLALVETGLAKLCFLYGKMRAMVAFYGLLSLLSIHRILELRIFLAQLLCA
uniref:SFRICE_014750 n=1 Tax=Spodoptera frugiperda TaxID=7108 RepID=A0A2H1WPI4_SPOFR